MDEIYEYPYTAPHYMPTPGKTGVWYSSLAAFATAREAHVPTPGDGTLESGGD